MNMRNLTAGALFLFFILSACQAGRQPTQIQVTLIVDGRERIFSLSNPTTVEEFLRDPKVDVQLGELDRINPPPFTQITDGLQIRIARVSQSDDCKQEQVPYRPRTVLNEGLKPGEQRVVQTGQNGIEEICYRVTLEDGTETDRVETRRTEIKAAQDELIHVGPTGEIEPVPVTGTLVYVSNGNVWVIQGSSTNKKPITTESDLDKRVFSLSSDGRQLLFTRTTANSQVDNVINQLWLISDIMLPSPSIPLVLNNILYADWIPGQENTISYSTAQPQSATPGWRALNDFWQMRIDPDTGESLNVKEVVPQSGGGYYGWWGTRFQWSPDGQELAWSRANGMGLVNLEDGSLEPPLLSYRELRTVVDWSWRSTVSWSPDSQFILTTVHGAPIGTESPDSSPAFHVTATDVAGDFQADLVPNSGIWSVPQYSPTVNSSSSEFPQVRIAYLRARDAFNSINSEYDLVVADRDGSNARPIFPGVDRPGLTALDTQQSIFNNRVFTWSPDGQQIAIIYQGNLWVVDAESGVTHQLTLDNSASNPIWVR
jgi:hypothetical protein